MTGPDPAIGAARDAAREQWTRLLPGLVSRGATVATAESLTGGQLAAVLTAVPGASVAFAGGIVSYSTAVKTEVLGVPPDLVAAHGVVSAVCAQQMAERAQSLFATTYAMATTGVAGPEEQEGRPVGTVYVAVAGPGETVVRPLALSGSRAGIQAAALVAALSELAARVGL